MSDEWRAGDDAGEDDSMPVDSVELAQMLAGAAERSAVPMVVETTETLRDLRDLHAPDYHDESRADT